MNQTELNKIALHFINDQSNRLTDKLLDVLKNDAKDKSNTFPGSTIRLIFNTAIFHLMATINCNIRPDDSNETASKDYYRFAQSFKPQFFDLCEQLRDFGQNDSSSESKD